MGNANDCAHEWGVEFGGKDGETIDSLKCTRCSRRTVVRFERQPQKVAVSDSQTAEEVLKNLEKNSLAVSALPRNIGPGLLERGVEECFKDVGLSSHLGVMLCNHLVHVLTNEDLGKQSQANVKLIEMLREYIQNNK